MTRLSPRSRVRQLLLPLVVLLVTLPLATFACDIYLSDGAEASDNGQNPCTGSGSPCRSFEEAWQRLLSNSGSCSQKTLHLKGRHSTSTSVGGIPSYDIPSLSSYEISGEWDSSSLEDGPETHSLIIDGPFVLGANASLSISSISIEYATDAYESNTPAACIDASLASSLSLNNVALFNCWSNDGSDDKEWTVGAIAFGVPSSLSTNWNYPKTLDLHDVIIDGAWSSNGIGALFVGAGTTFRTSDLTISHNTGAVVGGIYIDSSVELITTNGQADTVLITENQALSGLVGGLYTASPLTWSDDFGSENVWPNWRVYDNSASSVGSSPIPANVRCDSELGSDPTLCMSCDTSDCSAAAPCGLNAHAGDYCKDPLTSCLISDVMLPAPSGESPNPLADLASSILCPFLPPQVPTLSISFPTAVYQVSSTVDFVNTAFNLKGPVTLVFSSDAQIALSGGLMQARDIAFSGADDHFVPSFGGCLKVKDFAGVYIKDSSFTGCSASIGGALALGQGDYATLEDVTFTGNTALIRGGAIYGASQASATLSNVVITGSSAPEGAAMYLDSDSFFSYAGVNSLVSGNTVTDPNSGVIAADEASLSLFDSEITITDSIACYHNPEGDLGINYPCIPCDGSSCSKCILPSVADRCGTVCTVPVHLDASDPNPPDLASLIHPESNPCHEYHVSGEFLVESVVTIPEGMSVVFKGITPDAELRFSTTLADRGAPARYIGFEGDVLEFHDLTISKGVSYADGGCVFVASAQAFVASNVIFDDCYAGSFGGAVSLSSATSAIFTNCSFINNSAFGGAAVSASNNVPTLSFSQVTMQDNRVARSGTLYLRNTDPIATNLVIKDNSCASQTGCQGGGAGIACWDCNLSGLLDGDNVVFNNEDANVDCDLDPKGAPTPNCIACTTSCDEHAPCALYTDYTAPAPGITQGGCALSNMYFDPTTSEPYVAGYYCTNPDSPCAAWPAAEWSNSTYYPWNAVIDFHFLAPGSILIDGIIELWHSETYTWHGYSTNPADSTIRFNNPTSSHFYIGDGTLALKDLTVADGYNADDTGGGCVSLSAYEGDGILETNNVVFDNCQAEYEGPIHLAGSKSSAFFKDTIIKNSRSFSGPAVLSVYDRATVTTRGLTTFNNVGTTSAGIIIQSRSSLYIEDSDSVLSNTFVTNSAVAFGDMGGASFDRTSAVQHGIYQQQSGETISSPNGHRIPEVLCAGSSITSPDYVKAHLQSTSSFCIPCSSVEECDCAALSSVPVCYDTVTGCKAPFDNTVSSTGQLQTLWAFLANVQCPQDAAVDIYFEDGFYSLTQTLELHPGLRVNFIGINSVPAVSLDLGSAYHLSVVPHSHLGIVNLVVQRGYGDHTTKGACIALEGDGYTSTILVQDSLLTGCVSDWYGVGAALGMEHGRGTLSNTLISENVASTGSGFYLESSVIELNNVVITGNNATSFAAGMFLGGGSIVISGPGSFIVDNTLLTNLDVPWTPSIKGAGVYCQDCNMGPMAGTVIASNTVINTGTGEIIVPSRGEKGAVVYTEEDLGPESNVYCTSPWEGGCIPCDVCTAPSGACLTPAVPTDSGILQVESQCLCTLPAFASDLFEIDETCALLEKDGDDPLQVETLVLYVDSANGDDSDGLNQCTDPITPCSSLNHAMGQANGLSTNVITLAPGVHNVSGTVSPPSSATTFSLAGAGSSTTIVNWPADSPLGHMVVSGVPIVSFSGLSFTGGRSEGDGGCLSIALTQSSEVPPVVAFYDVVFSDCIADDSGGALYVYDPTGEATVDMDLFHVNGAQAFSGNGGGVAIITPDPTTTTATRNHAPRSSTRSLLADNAVLTRSRLSRSSIQNTYAGGNGGGFFSRGLATLTESQIEDTSADSNGGGVAAECGSLTLYTSTVKGCLALELGGGIYVEDDGTALILFDSTISNNQAYIDGGAIYAQGITSVLGSTAISGNSVPGTGSLARGVTVAAVQASGGIVCSACTLTTGKLIRVADNLGPDPSTLSGNPVNVRCSASALGECLGLPNGCGSCKGGVGTCYFPSLGITGAQPSAFGCACRAGLVTESFDCDGDFLVVDPTRGSDLFGACAIGSPCATLEKAIENAAPEQVIVLEPAVHVVTSRVPLDKNLDFVGLNFEDTIIDFQDTGSLIVTGNSLNLAFTAITLRNGASDRNGGCLSAGGDGQDDIDLKLTNVQFDSCSSSSGRGGAFAIGVNSRAVIKDSVIANCDARDGAGGIALFENAQVTSNNLTIDSCSTTQSGGGIWVDGSSQFRGTNTFIDNNEAGEWGGGIYIGPETTGSVVNLKGGRITGNTAQLGGAFLVYGNPTGPFKWNDKQPRMILRNKFLVSGNNALLTIQYPGAAGYVVWGQLRVFNRVRIVDNSNSLVIQGARFITWNRVFISSNGATSNIDCLSTSSPDYGDGYCSSSQEAFCGQCEEPNGYCYLPWMRWQPNKYLEPTENGCSCTDPAYALDPACFVPVCGLNGGLESYEGCNDLNLCSYGETGDAGGACCGSFRCASDASDSPLCSDAVCLREVASDRTALIIGADPMGMAAIDQWLSLSGYTVTVIRMGDDPQALDDHYAVIIVADGTDSLTPASWMHSAILQILRHPSDSLLLTEGSGSAWALNEAQLLGTYASDAGSASLHPTVEIDPWTALLHPSIADAVEPPSSGSASEFLRLNGWSPSSASGGGRRLVADSTSPGSTLEIMAQRGLFDQPSTKFPAIIGGIIDPAIGSGHVVVVAWSWGVAVGTDGADRVSTDSVLLSAALAYDACTSSQETPMYRNPSAVVGNVRHPAACLPCPDPELMLTADKARSTVSRRSCPIFDPLGLFTSSSQRKRFAGQAGEWGPNVLSHLSVSSSSRYIQDGWFGQGSALPVTTLEFWIRPTAYDPSRTAPSVIASTPDLFMLTLAPTSTSNTASESEIRTAGLSVDLFLHSLSFPGQVTAVSSLTNFMNTWNHVVLVFDVAGGDLSLILNGVSVGMTLPMDPAIILTDGAISFPGSDVSLDGEGDPAALLALDVSTLRAWYPTSGSVPSTYLGYYTSSPDVDASGIAQQTFLAAGAIPFEVSTTLGLAESSPQAAENAIVWSDSVGLEAVFNGVVPSTIPIAPLCSTFAPGCPNGITFEAWIRVEPHVDWADGGNTVNVVSFGQPVTQSSHVDYLNSEGWVARWTRPTEGSSTGEVEVYFNTDIANFIPQASFPAEDQWVDPRPTGTSVRFDVTPGYVHLAVSLNMAEGTLVFSLNGQTISSRGEDAAFTGFSPVLLDTAAFNIGLAPCTVRDIRIWHGTLPQTELGWYSPWMDTALTSRNFNDTFTNDPVTLLGWYAIAGEPLWITARDRVSNRAGLGLPDLVLHWGALNINATNDGLGGDPTIGGSSGLVVATTDVVSGLYGWAQIPESPLSSSNEWYRGFWKDAFTVELWMMPMVPSDGGETLIHASNSGNSLGSGFRLLRRADGNIRLCVRVSGAGSLCTTTVNAGLDKLSLGQWSHVAGVFDGSQVIVYVDGALAASKSLIEANSGVSQGSIQWGADAGLFVGISHDQEPSSLMLAGVRGWSLALDRVELGYFESSLSPNRVLDSTCLFSYSGVGDVPTAVYGVEDDSSYGRHVLHWHPSFNGHPSVPLSSGYGPKVVFSETAAEQRVELAPGPRSGPSGKIGGAAEAVISPLDTPIGPVLAQDGPVSVGQDPFTCESLGSAFSVELWVYRLADTADLRTPLLTCGWDNANGTEYGWNLSLQDRTRLTFSFALDDAADSDPAYKLVGGFVQVGEWTHVAATWDGEDTNTASLYVNGIPTASFLSTFGGSMAFPNTTEASELQDPLYMRLGERADVSYSHALARARFSDLRVWSRALDQTELGFYRARTALASTTSTLDDPVGLPYASDAIVEAANRGLQLALMSPATPMARYVVVDGDVLSDSFDVITADLTAEGTFANADGDSPAFPTVDALVDTSGRARHRLIESEDWTPVAQARLCAPGTAGPDCEICDSCTSASCDVPACSPMRRWGQARLVSPVRVRIVILSPFQALREFMAGFFGAAGHTVYACDTGTSSYPRSPDGCAATDATVDVIILADGTHDLDDEWEDWVNARLANQRVLVITDGSGSEWVLESQIFNDLLPEYNDAGEGPDCGTGGELRSCGHTGPTTISWTSQSTVLRSHATRGLSGVAMSGSLRRHVSVKPDGFLESLTDSITDLVGLPSNIFGQVGEDDEATAERESEIIATFTDDPSYIAIAGGRPDSGDSAGRILLLNWYWGYSLMTNGDRAEGQLVMDALLYWPCPLGARKLDVNWTPETGLQRSCRVCPAGTSPENNELTLGEIGPISSYDCMCSGDVCSQATLRSTGSSTLIADVVREPLVARATEDATAAYAALAAAQAAGSNSTSALEAAVEAIESAQALPQFQASSRSAPDARLTWEVAPSDLLSRGVYVVLAATEEDIVSEATEGVALFQAQGTSGEGNDGEAGIVGEVTVNRAWTGEVDLTYVVGPDGTSSRLWGRAYSLLGCSEEQIEAHSGFSNGTHAAFLSNELFLDSGALFPWQEVGQDAREGLARPDLCTWVVPPFHGYDSIVWSRTLRSAVNASDVDTAWMDTGAVPVFTDAAVVITDGTDSLNAAGNDSRVITWSSSVFDSSWAMWVLPAKPYCGLELGANGTLEVDTSALNVSTVVNGTALTTGAWFQPWHNLSAVAVEAWVNIPACNAAGADETLTIDFGERGNVSDPTMGWSLSIGCGLGGFDTPNVRWTHDGTSILECVAAGGSFDFGVWTHVSASVRVGSPSVLALNGQPCSVVPVGTPFVYPDTAEGLDSLGFSISTTALTHERFSVSNVRVWSGADLPFPPWEQPTRVVPAVTLSPFQGRWHNKLLFHAPLTLGDTLDVASAELPLVLVGGNPTLTSCESTPPPLDAKLAGPFGSNTVQCGQRIGNGIEWYSIVNLPATGVDTGKEVVNPFADLTSWTLSSWFKLDDTSHLVCNTTDPVPLVQYGDGLTEGFGLYLDCATPSTESEVSNGGGLTVSWVVALPAPFNDRMTIEGAAGQAAPTVQIPTGVWFSLTGTWDGDTAKLYLNDFQVGTMSIPGGLGITPIMPDSDGFAALRGGANDTALWSGSMATLRAWNRALTEDEVYFAWNAWRQDLDGSAIGSYTMVDPWSTPLTTFPEANWTLGIVDHEIPDKTVRLGGLHLSPLVVFGGYVAETCPVQPPIVPSVPRDYCSESVCGAGGECIRLRDKTYECRCLPGFGSAECTDIDECQEALPGNACAAYPNTLECTNTYGSFHCACIDQYVGDPVKGLPCQQVEVPAAVDAEVNFVPLPAPRTVLPFGIGLALFFIACIVAVVVLKRLGVFNEAKKANKAKMEEGGRLDKTEAEKKKIKEEEEAAAAAKRPPIIRMDSTMEAVAKLQASPTGPDEIGVDVDDDSPPNGTAKKV